ncbi:MAG: histidine kinase [Sandaracinaceae bacterium]|nr:histidine kinase [Sandaracinaceae bacterium]MBP7682144.1 histidine kinase [Deltaproteobacteria bacterium]MBK6810015.1 histidine kinase [Sandaracinaceae bacterium]MBK7153596.1 histidine kinase [Sandaracinaceae bacterium]MBK7778218.1 histidine kinase [Sandaracinaceae bacterium]
MSSPAAASSGPPSPGLHSATHAGLASTWRALAEARRAVPITLVCSALLATEYLTTRSLPALLTLLGFLVAFVLLVPAAWRWVERGSRAPARGLAYGLLCVSLVALTTVGLPPLLGFEPYVAHPPAAAAILTLAAMAGFILGRDIDLSAGLIMAEQRSSELLREAENARLLALRQHLDPHFLFNTLGAIAEWCREDPLVAERALLELSTMLRTLFDGIRTPLWPIAREVEVLLALQRLYALRDDERYPLNTDLSGLSSADMVEIPPLVLLPLFENALTHGAPGAPLSLALAVTAGALEVTLWNSGEYRGRREGGTGIDTAERRLRIAFGSAAQLSVVAEPRDGVAGTCTRVRIAASPPRTPGASA